MFFSHFGIKYNKLNLSAHIKSWDIAKALRVREGGKGSS